MHNNKLYLLVIVSLAFIFTGCGSPKVAPPKKVELPSWIKKQPQDTKQTTYGLGIDKNREDALKSALNDVISKLGIKLESNFSNKQIVDGYYSRTITTSDIKTDVSKIRVTNYDVEKSHRVSYREYAVLVKVDNKKFFSSLKKDIDKMKKDIKNEYTNSMKLDSISRYRVKKSISKECDRLLSNTLVAKELYSNFNTKPYFDFVSKMKKDFKNEVNSLNFYISGDSNSKNFTQIIKQQLLDNGFNVSKSKKANSVKIFLNSTDDFSKKSNIVTVKLNIKVNDANKVVGTNSLVLKERYKNSKSKVYNSAAIHFKQDIESLQIEKVLGIGIN